MARISRRFPSQAKLLKEGASLARGVANNLEDLPHLAIFGTKLQNRVQEIRELAGRESALRAELLEVTRQIRESMDSASKLVTLLETGIKEHYGSENERLVEFGVQPFRGLRRRNSAKTAPESPEEEPASPAPGLE